MLWIHKSTLQMKENILLVAAGWVRGGEPTCHMPVDALPQLSHRGCSAGLSVVSGQPTVLCSPIPHSFTSSEPFIAATNVRETLRALLFITNSDENRILCQEDPKITFHYKQKSFMNTRIANNEWWPTIIINFLPSQYIYS